MKSLPLTIFNKMGCSAGKVAIEPTTRQPNLSKLTLTKKPHKISEFPNQDSTYLDQEGIVTIRKEIWRLQNYFQKNLHPQKSYSHEKVQNIVIPIKDTKSISSAESIKRKNSTDKILDTPDFFKREAPKITINNNNFFYNNKKLPKIKETSGSKECSSIGKKSTNSENEFSKEFLSRDSQKSEGRNSKPIGKSKFAKNEPKTKSMQNSPDKGYLSVSNFTTEYRLSPCQNLKIKDMSCHTRKKFSKKSPGKFKVLNHKKQNSKNGKLPFEGKMLSLKDFIKLSKKKNLKKIPSLTATTKSSNQNLISFEPKKRSSIESFNNNVAMGFISDFDKFSLKKDMGSRAFSSKSPDQLKKVKVILIRKILKLKKINLFLCTKEKEHQNLL